MHASLSQLFVVNLLLQLFDGLGSYYILSTGVPEANPVVATAIEQWGLFKGLLFSKLTGCALLIVVFILGHQVRKIAYRGLTMLVYVYSCLVAMMIVKMLQLFA